MTVRQLLLIAHIGAVVLFVGPVTVTASMFPRVISTGGDSAAALLHRVTRSYGLSSLAVPATGLALANESGLWSAAWLWLSLGLYTVATAILFGLVVPQQRRAIAAEGERRLPRAEELGPLHATAGLFSAIWVVILGLMVVKPW